MVTVCVPGRAGTRFLRLLACLGIFTAVSACAVDITEYTPFAQDKQEIRVARETKSDPITTASIGASSAKSSSERIVTKPVFASASRMTPAERSKMGDRISDPGSAVARETPPGSVIVARGDTLYGIARRYRVRLTELMTLNNIMRATSLRQDQRLQLPGGPSLPEPVAAGSRQAVSLGRVPLRLAETIVVTPVSGTGGRKVTVTSGTTLYRIATRNGVSVGELARANGISDPARVRAGTVLTVPGPDAARASDPAPAPAPARPMATREPRFTFGNEDEQPVRPGAMPASERDLSKQSRRRARRRAAAIAAYKRTANEYRLTPGQAVLVPF